MSPFDGYDQAHGAYLAMPWWVNGKRTDGRWSEAFGVGGRWSKEYYPGPALTALLRAVDLAHPHPVPTARCGQVWVLPHISAQVVAVDTLGWTCPDGDEKTPCAHWPVGFDANGAEWTALDAWPVEGAVLVAGPGAPWAPPGWVGGE